MLPCAAMTAVTLIGAMLLLRAVLSLGPTDDAYITFRHATNFAAGDGLVFNPGERVEATTSFLFALLVGVAVWLGADPAPAALVLNLFALGLALFLLFDTRHGAPARARCLAGLTAAVFVSFMPGVFFYSVVGMETVFSAALLATGALLVTRAGSRTAFLAAGIFLGLAAAARLDTLVLLPAIAVAALSRPDARRHRAWLLCGALGLGAILIPVVAARYLYYGDVLPNTYYAKAVGVTAPSRLRGLLYVLDSFLMYPGLAVVLAIGTRHLAADRPARPAAVLLAAATLSQALYVTWIGGDYFPFYRFMVPLLPLSGLLVADLASFFFARLVDSKRRARLVGLTALTLVAAAAPAAIALVHSTHARFAAAQQDFGVKYEIIGRLLAKNAPRDAVLLVDAAGAIPYYSGLRAYDFFGLTDPLVSHKPNQDPVALPGHGKTSFFAQIAGRRPDLVLLHHWMNGDPLRERQRWRQRTALVGAIRRAVISRIVPEYALYSLEKGNVGAVFAVKTTIAGRLGPAFVPMPSTGKDEAR
jgi:arabinofuranosyltransferase